MPHRGLLIAAIMLAITGAILLIASHRNLERLLAVYEQQSGKLVEAAEKSEE